MLTQLQLEGPELEPLLARVRNELGASARIVHAEKIRSGGVAGFFAHQRFELTVEVDTSQPRVPATPARPASVAAAPVGAAPVDAAPVGGAPVGGAPIAAGPVAATAAAAPAHVDLALDRSLDLDAAARSAASEPPFHAIAGLQPGTAPDDTSLFSSLATLADAAPTPAPVRVPTPAHAAASAYAPQAAVSASPRADVAPPAVEAVTAAAVAPAAAVTPAPTPVEPVHVAAEATLLPPSTAAATGFAPHAAFAALVDGGPAHPPVADPAASLLELADRVSADEHSALVSTETPSFASVMARLGDGLGAEPARGEAPRVVEGDSAAAVGSVPSQRPPSPVPPSPVAPAAVPASVAPVAPAAAVEVRVAARTDPAPAVPAPGTAATLAALEAETADPAATARAEEAAALELTRLGLPAHLLPAGGYGQQLHTALRASLTRLPTAPPALNRAGGVLAVVGPLALAVAVARELAHELGLPVATSVALATSGTATADVPDRQVLHATPEAAERRTAWRRRSNLTVVAVDAPLTATGAAEARAFLAALSPSATWGVVEATRKAQDVGAWTRALGGVHALALTDLEETADPAAVLELGIPVTRLGGRPATPRAWATLLTGRLAA